MMKNQKRLAKINLYDKLNAGFVSLITPEMPELQRIRKANNYSTVPTFEKPFDMPLEHISLGGTKIRVATSIIDPSKESVVFLSAFPHSIIAYSPVWEQLKNHYNLYAYDMPGFGASQVGEELMSFRFQGEFLGSFLRHYDIEASHVVAPDVGMPSALSYVINHEHKIKSLMIGDGPAALPVSEPSVMRKMVHSGFWRLMFVIAGSGALVESAKNLCNVRYVPNKYEMSDYKKCYTGKVSTSMRWFKKYPEMLKDIDSNLEDVTVPTKIFWGEHEAILHTENATRINDRIPYSELEIFTGCGHFVYQDDIPRFTDMIQSWVTKNTSSH